MHEACKILELDSLVFPDPRKPVMMVMGIMVIMEEGIKSGHYRTE